MTFSTRQSILFVDWDGTLCTERFWQQYREQRTDTYQKIQEMLFGKSNPILRDWMLGNMTAEEVCVWLAPQLGIESSVIFNDLVASCDFRSLSEEHRATLTTLRDRSFLVLVTDNMDVFSRFIIPSLHLDQLFDLILNSSAIGRMKIDTNGKTYTDITEHYSIPMEQTILIDDSAKTCELFSHLGGKKLLYDRS